MPRIKTKSVEDEEGNIISFIDGDETKITSVTDKSGNSVQYSEDASLKVQFADGNSYKESMNGRQRVQEIYNKAENTITTYRDGKLAHLSEKGEDFYFSFNEDGKVNSFKTSYGTVVCEDGKPHHFKAKGKEFHCENFEVYSEEFEFGKHYYDVNTGDLLRTDFAEGVKSYHVPFSFDDDRDVWKAWADEKIGAKGTVDYSIPRLEDFEAKVAKVEQVTQAAALKFHSERVATKAALKAQAAASKETVSLVELMTLETGRNISGDPMGTWEKVAALSQEYDFYELQKRYPIEKIADELETATMLAKKRGETVTIESLEENIKKLAEKHNVPLEFTDKELPKGKTVHIVQDEAVGCYSHDASVRASQRSRAINDKILQYERLGVKCGVSLDVADIQWKEPILSGNGETVLQKLGADGQIKRAMDETGAVFFYEKKANGDGVYIEHVLDKEGRTETYLRENGTSERTHFLRCKYDEPEDIFYREDGVTKEKEIISGSKETHYYDEAGKDVVKAETKEGKLIFTMDENKTKTTYYPDGETIHTVNYADGSKKVYDKDLFMNIVADVPEDDCKKLIVTDKEGNKTTYKGWTEEEILSVEDVKGNKKEYVGGVLYSEYDAEKKLTATYYKDGEHVKTITNSKGQKGYVRPDGTKDTIEHLHGTVDGRSGTVRHFETDGKTVAWDAVVRGDKLSVAKDTKGNTIIYDVKDGSITRTTDAKGNETRYHSENRKTCLHADLGTIAHAEDGTFSIFVEEGTLFGDMTYNKDGRLLSYRDKMDFNTVYFKEDGKTVDRIVGPLYEDGKLIKEEVNIDINSERGKAILEGLDEAVEKRAPQIQEYCQTGKTIKEFNTRVQAEFKSYQEDILYGDFSKRYAEEAKKLFGKEAKQSVEQTAEKATTKAATKATLKTQAIKSARRAGGAAKGVAKSIGKGAMKVNAMYDAAFDKNVKILMEMDAPKWMKSLDNAMAKPLNMTAEQLQKAADAFMKTESGQKIAQKVAASYAKAGGKAMAASVAKKIPLACVGIACAMAKERYEKGEYVKAGLEVVSGVAACVPVFGTAVSLGIDGAVLLSDLQVFEHGAMPKDPNSHVAPESTFVDKPVINQAKLVRKVDKKAEEKKKAEAKKKAQQFEANLYQYGGKPSGNTWGS